MPRETQFSVINLLSSVYAPLEFCSMDLKYDFIVINTPLISPCKTSLSGRREFSRARRSSRAGNRTGEPITSVSFTYSRELGAHIVYTNLNNKVILSLIHLYTNFDELPDFSGDLG